MKELSRRGFMKISSMLGAALAGTATGKVVAQASGFQAASGSGGSSGQDGQDGPVGTGFNAKKGPGIQSVRALCEVTGGGQKVYGIAIEFDAVMSPGSLALDTFIPRVYPKQGGGGMMMGAMAQPTQQAEPRVRPVAAIYTNFAPVLLADQKSVAGVYVIAEFAHESDLSTPTTDSDKVTVVQSKAVKTEAGKLYAASATEVSNAGGRGNAVSIRGIDGWEQNHWWRDDARSAMLEYSIYLPKSFLKAGGENKEYPLLIAITHSGTSYDGTCLETLTEQCIASIWATPEEQAEHECVVITPRYERTTLNDYWEHTYDVENTYRLVATMLENRWNFGNPNMEDRCDKVLKIDSRRVYCTGWSMGAMTSLWMMAKHPETFAAGLIIAGQQRPSEVVDLARQNLLIITGAEDGKATPWNEKCVPVWEQAGARVTRPAERLDPALIFPVDDQRKLSEQVNGYLGKGGNITFLTFAKVDHMGSARKFFYIKAARNWLFQQRKS